MIYDFQLLLFLLPAFALSMVAQIWLQSAYARSRNVPARTTGYGAARAVLDGYGLRDVDIEQTPGQLSDHYDPREKVLRLSDEVFHGRSLAAVGIAAHEAGHALQDAQRYPLLAIRNAAVPAAGIGSGAGMMLLVLGVIFGLTPLLLLGIILFSGVVLFQLVNLPVEFDASRRAKAELVQLGIVDAQELPYVRRVLWAAALTYVAAAMQSVLTLLYYVMRYAGGRDE